MKQLASDIQDCLLNHPVFTTAYKDNPKYRLSVMAVFLIENDELEPEEIGEFCCFDGKSKRLTTDDSGMLQLLRDIANEKCDVIDVKKWLGLRKL